MVYTRRYTAPPYNTSEILRYAGVSGASPEAERLLQSCLPEAESVLRYQVCWAEFPLHCHNGNAEMGFAVPSSVDLYTHLQNCERVIVFAATVGIGLDQLIARYSRISPSKALLLQAIGAERIESLCDLFCSDIAAEKAAVGQGLTRRFSPGYGDLPLSFQQDLFRVLDCPRKIGLTLNESLLMSPSKSVTALMGVAAKSACLTHTASKCDTCPHTSCAFRRNK